MRRNTGAIWCSSLNGLYNNYVAHYAPGAQFAKWHMAFLICMAHKSSTDYAIHKAVHGLACYARIYQEDGLISIADPVVLVNEINRYRDQGRCCAGVDCACHLPEAEEAQHPVQDLV